MFPECRLLNEKLNPFEKIATETTCVIIIAKVVWIRQTIVTQFATFPRFDQHRIGHFVQPFELSVGRSEVADSSRCRVPEMLADSSLAHVVLDAPVE